MIATHIPLDRFELEILIKALDDKIKKLDLTKERYNFDIAVSLEKKLREAHAHLSKLR